jgi:hypothetical protein
VTVLGEVESGVVMFDFPYWSLLEVCRCRIGEMRVPGLAGKVQTMATRGAYACEDW